MICHFCKFPITWLEIIFGRTVSVMDTHKNVQNYHATCERLRHDRLRIKAGLGSKRK